MQKSLFDENTLLLSEIQGLKTTITRQEEQAILHTAEVERLKEMLIGLQRQKFGSKKERWESDEQVLFELFNETEVESDRPGTQDVEGPESEVEISVDGFTRKRGKRMPLPEHLPREIVVVELPANERFTADGTPLRVIGKEVSEKLVYEPSTMKVMAYHRYRYGVDSGETLKTAPPVPAIIPKGIASPSLIAGIVTQKYADGLPLYRQEDIFSRQGVELPRCTMARWIVRSSEMCMPIWNALEERLMMSPYVTCDETHTQVLKEKGRRAESKSWMWVRATPSDDKKIVLFDYDPHRSGDVAKRLFADYKGFLQADGYGAYNILEKQDGVTRIGCNMHGRRGFFEASDHGAKTGRPLADQGLKYYQLLNDIEEKAKTQGMIWAERFELRTKEARPIWDEMKKWAEENAAKVPPKSKLGHAFHYFNTQYELLAGYLKDGRLEIDNGFTERMIRKFAIGRNNWLFADTEDGAGASALFYSFVVTAKINGVNPYQALKQIFELVPLAKDIEDYERLADLLLSPAK